MSVTLLPSCRHGDVPTCDACLVESADLVDPACRQCGRGTWLDDHGDPDLPIHLRTPALVCDTCAAAGWYHLPGESFTRWRDPAEATA